MKHPCAHTSRPLTYQNKYWNAVKIHNFAKIVSEEVYSTVNDLENRNSTQWEMPYFDEESTTECESD